MTRAPLQATRRPHRPGLRSGLAGTATALAALAAPAAAQEPDSTMVPVDSVIVSPDVPLATAVGGFVQDSWSILDKVTLNVGVVRGGLRANVVPDLFTGGGTPSPWLTTSAPRTSR